MMGIYKKNLLFLSGAIFRFLEWIFESVWCLGMSAGCIWQGSMFPGLAGFVSYGKKSCGGQRLLLLTVPEGTNQSCHTRKITAWWFWWIWWWWVDEILMTFWFNELIVLQHFDDEDCGTIMSWWGWQWLWLWWWFQWLSWWCRFCWYIMVVTASQLRETDDCEQWP